MNRVRKRLLKVENVCKAKYLVAVLGIVVCTTAGWGQSGGDYNLSWSTVAGGGGVSSGGSYVVKGSAGELDAGVMAGGRYELLGGFWPGEPLCTVAFHRYARFAEYWLDSGCDAGNDWCRGADLDQLGDVDGLDLRLFANEWLSYCPYDWPLR